jgi:hypothetical protein
MTSNYELPQAWANYINQLNPRWSWYGHFTFRDFPHPERCIKTWALWIAKLNKEIYGNRYYKKPVSICWVRATELQERGCPHFHAVIGNVPSDVRRLEWLDRWNEIAGFARILPYLAHRGAEFYMSKSAYAWKNGEIDVSNNLPDNPLALTV